MRLWEFIYRMFRKPIEDTSEPYQHEWYRLQMTHIGGGFNGFWVSIAGSSSLDSARELMQRQIDQMPNASYRVVNDLGDLHFIWRGASKASKIPVFNNEPSVYCHGF